MWGGGGGKGRRGVERGKPITPSLHKQVQACKLCLHTDLIADTMLVCMCGAFVWGFPPREQAVWPLTGPAAALASGSPRVFDPATEKG